jgi:hypothetical protein
MIETTAYLLQNQMNPFPIEGQLVLSDDGQLTFTLDERSAAAFLGWLEKRLSVQDLKERIGAGERPTAFAVPVAGHKFDWPKSLGGYGMKFEDGDHKWIVTLEYPSGNGISQMRNIFTAKRTRKPWVDALAAAGAS